jgi:hypothetical protein
VLGVGEWLMGCGCGGEEEASGAHVLMGRSNGRMAADGGEHRGEERRQHFAWPAADVGNPRPATMPAQVGLGLPGRLGHRPVALDLGLVELQGVAAVRAHLTVTVAPGVRRVVVAC